MISFNSKYSADELIERWDEFTSPSRFAGSDENMDLIFMSKRKVNKVRLTRRARQSREPFSCIFRGKIEKTENGSVIKGIFTKSIFDYAFVGIVFALLFYIRKLIIERGDSLNTINALLVCWIVFGLFLLFNSRSAKRRFADFITRITEEENIHFLSKREKADKEID